jgi:hypothetical protein
LDNIGEKRYLAMERPALKVEGDTLALEVIGQIIEVAGESWGDQTRRTISHSMEAIWRII